MKLRDKLKQDISVCRLQQNMQKLKSLQTIVGELERKTKEAEDELVIQTVKKTISQLQECLQSKDVPEFRQEIEWLSEYLPTQLSESELTNIIQSAGSNIGQVMKYLKENYSGRYDGKLASRIAKQILQ